MPQKYEHRPTPAPVVGQRPQRPPQPYPSSSLQVHTSIWCENILVQSPLSLGPADTAGSSLLRIFLLVVCLHSCGEQPSVRNGENPSAEGGGRSAGWGRLLLPLYVKWMQVSKYKRNIPSPKAEVQGGQIVHRCYCKKRHTKKTSYNLFPLQFIPKCKTFIYLQLITNIVIIFRLLSCKTGIDWIEKFFNREISIFRKVLI